MRGDEFGARPWPLMRRTSIIDSVVASLTARPPRSQLLRGASGIGKTTVAAHVSSVLESLGRRTVPIVALAELRDVPLAALAPVLSANAVTGGDTAERVQSLVRLIGAAPQDYVLIVDDAPLLDEVSASVVYQLVRVFGVPAVLTARDEHEVIGPIARLMHEDLVTVSEVAPLTAGEVNALVEDHLHESLRPESGSALFRATEGNPLFLRELMFAAERAGGVRPGPFGMEVEPTRLAAHLLDAVRARLADLPPEALHFARLLAVSQPWPETLAAQHASAGLDELRRRDLVAVDNGRVRLAHPFFTEVVTADLPNTVSARITSAAANILRSTGEASDRFAAVHLVADSPDADAAELEWAAGFAIAVGDFTQARRLAGRAAKCGAGFTATLLGAVAGSALGQEGVGAEFAAAVGQAGDDDERAVAHLRWGQHVAYRLRDPADAAARAGAVLPTLAADAAAVLAPELAKWRTMTGDATAGDLAPDAGLDPLALVSTSVGAAMFATMAGYAVRARDAVAAARPHLDAVRMDFPHAGDLLDLSEFLVEVSEGRIAEARSLAEARRSAGSPDAAGMWSYTLALVELHAGQHDAADALAELAVRQLEWRDFTGLVGAALALAATTAALVGDSARAARLLDRLDDAARLDIKVALQATEASAWLLAHEGTASGDDLRIAVESALAQGHPVLGALTASQAIRLGEAQAVAGILDDSSSPSVLVRLVAESAHAAAGADHEAALALVPDLRSAGLAAVARRLVEDAARGAHDPSVRRRAQLLAGELGALSQPDPIGRASDGFALSAREWEIARAAGDRLRNREIAERLGVSVRTVENHLANVYRKLGVSGRDDIAAVLDARER